MPRPPLLPKIEWKNVFEKGLNFQAWLAQAEFPDSAKKMQADFETFALNTEVAEWLGSIPKNVNIVCIAEDWCGDVTRHVPLLERVVAASAGKISTRYITREGNTDIFARFLTNGGEALPKFVFLSTDWTECGNWGPMIQECKELIARGKACNDVPSARSKVSAIYKQPETKDRVVEELLEMIDIASTASVSQ